MIARSERLDPAAGRLSGVSAALVPDGPIHHVLAGQWLGHPLHPMLTDLPIGFWTGASVLDLAGGPRSRPAAGAFVGLGVLSAAPTFASGLAEARVAVPVTNDSS